MCKQKRITLKKIPGFSLIELSFVMIIIGIIMGAVFKGQDLLETARLQSCTNDLNRYRLGIMMYLEQFKQFPGNDANAKNHFGSGATNGDGQGLIQATEQEHVWKHLHMAGLVDSEKPPTVRIGGTISAVSNPQTLKGNFLILSKTPGKLDPVLTPRQAMTLKSKAGETKGDEGNFLILEGEGGSDSCLKEGGFNLTVKKPSCIVAMPF